MNCPYCQKRIDAWSGLQELQKFQRHLRACRKNPANRPLVVGEGEDAVTLPQREQSLHEALEIRAASGQ